MNPAAPAMSPTVYALLAILVMSGVTFLTRVIPFAFFRGGTPPPIVLWLGRAVPPVAMTLLLISSVASVSWTEPPYGLPELAALAAVALLHVTTRNALLSIFGATILYMVLIQTGLVLRLLGA